MAKKVKLVEAEEGIKSLEPEPEAFKSVKFLRDFEGSLNGFSIKVSKYQLDEVFELPLVVYDWIQKFKVCKDA